MAIYHASAKIISRSGGKSVVASAAYRAGDKLTDERLGKSFDYTKKLGVDSTIILAPENAPDWVMNREKLWNEVEAVENRKDSQLAREFNIALPRELSKEPMKALALSYVREQFVDRGMIADVAFHDLDSDNPHFHVLLTMRDITEQGFSLKKNRDWNSTELLVEQREAWANHVNAALKRIGLVEEKIDHRTLVAQGIKDRIAQVHLGPELHRIREESIEQGDLAEFRDKYQIGELYETINEINRELAAHFVALEELNELMAISQEAREEIFQQATSLPEAQNIAMNPNEQKEESNRDPERESTAEPIDLTERLQGITDYFTSSSLQADESRRRLHSLADRLRGSSGEVGSNREPSQSIGEDTAAEIERPTEPSGQPTGGLEKGAGSRSQSSAAESIDQSEQNQQKLSSNLGSRAVRPGANERATGQDRSSHVAETGGSNSNFEQSTGLELDQDLSPEWSLNRTNQGPGEQHRNQDQPNREAENSLTSQQRQLDLIHQAAIATIIRLMHSLDEETFEGQRYRIQVSADYETVEMYALDGRGLILQKQDGQISGQLSDEDLQAIEQLNQQLDRREGQRQVDNCMPVLARLLIASGQYRQDNATRFLDFDSTTQIMTYRYKENPEDFLVAKRTEQGWDYQEGKLTPEREKAIAVELDQWLRQQEKAQTKEKERSQGFER